MYLEIYISVGSCVLDVYSYCIIFYLARARCFTLREEVDGGRPYLESPGQRTIPG